MLPPIAVALSACAAVLFVVRTTGPRPSLTLWSVLAGAVSVTFAAILIAAVAARRTAKSVSDRIGALRRSSARGEADLRALVEALRRGDGPPKRKSRSGPPEGADDFELLAADLARAHDGAVTAVVQASQLSSQAGSEQKLEVFVNLARRLQSLVHREISILDELENEIEDPDLLKGLFHVDHLATRIRRHAENLAVLGGAVSRRQWSNPVSMTEVLRSAIAEVEQYSRVKLVPPIDGTLRGHAVADVIHLLAELVENATVFSAPHTQVLLRANLVTSGLAVEVEDRGLGMPVGEQNRMNALLADPDQVNVASLLADGRIGLFVVSQLAKRHGIQVRLQTNIYGGVQAVLVVPQGVLGREPGARGGAARTQEPQGAAGTAVPPHTTSQAPAQQTPVPPQQHRQPASAAPAASEGGQRGAAEASPGTPRRQQPRTGGRGADARTDGSGPAPLPVRGAKEERPNPSEAVPGIRPDERRLLAENTVAPPTPRTSTVRGTMGKPQLPRRRAQEHIAPQLRGGPAPRQESDHLAGHDPGLMAAFQRGIGLAETQQHMESAHMESAHGDSGHLEAGHLDAGHVEAWHVEPGRMGAEDTGAEDMGGGHMGAEPMGGAHTVGGSAESGRRESDRGEPGHSGGGSMNTRPGAADHMDAPHTASGHTTVSPTTFGYTTSGHTTSGHVESGHMDTRYMDTCYMDSGHADARHMESGPLDARHMDSGPVDGRHMDSGHMDFGHMGSAHTLTPRPSTSAYTPSTPITPDPMSPESEPTRLDPTSSEPTRLESVRPASIRLEPTSLDTGSPQPTGLRPTSLDALHTDVTSMTTRPPMDVSPMDHTTRHDGSAPAG
ncbi:ATPase [Streptomyces curacoi]|uniref:histidine kinase n=1 Tax=Streptomyces curacoi TaxID=146536 RepID=A0A117PF78_9ACTN|nr:ATPase [Streptomyces curacoi]